ncbi:oligosaccharyl transferase, archaeosortase A system-associated [Natronomonas salsuginis]|uniref:dolichyl-phosphooligosaccharide-protein glycotransferase n=1 Tax=Natronomonas salsuginis TaxID=2217661 RepID=A0A4U5JFT2_9EURY|nr:oligosaccharyl transferase, archaeosortase A system-associated [Natronomonas salsuginis]TKR28262.1 oligosaccharyl transferase, archaeosortase A system-associated [Natronomonas salsuginis]
MSQRFEAIEERLDDYESQIDTVYRLYHIPVLAALMAFMLWIRVRHYSNHVGSDGRPLYRGNDPYYHYRSTRYVVEHYPFTMPFDPWTGFDAGTRAGQFGTIFDQVVATAAMIVGLGSPSESTIIATTLLTAPVIATLCAIPMYVIGRRLGGRFGGIIAVVVLALSAGQFLTRSVVGTYDHHVAEVLATLVALVFGMVMVTVAQRDRPIYEFFRTREFEPIGDSLKWAAAFGASLVVAVLVWPPAVFLFGIFAVFLLVHLSVEFVRGHSPDHVAIPSAIAMVVFAVLVSPFVVSMGLDVTDYSLLHPLFALAVAGGAAFMAGIARLWESRDLPRIAYPVGIVGMGLVGVAVVAVVLPDVFDFFVSQFRRVAGLGTTDTAATIGEAQSPSNPVSFFYGNYGFALYTAIGGFLLLSYRTLADERPRAEHVLITVFAAIMLLFTLTQLRFDYYLVIAVGAGNAYVVSWIYQFVDLDNVREDIRTVKPYQTLIVVAILFVIAGPLVATGATVTTVDRASQPGEMGQWTESLDWLSEETPEVGSYGSGDDPRLDFYGTYENTDDFEYEAGEYGVLAWWDYGHYITTRGERVPVANPFQQHATESADFLLADEEDEAIEILEEDQPEGESVRYVMVDYQLGYAGTRKYGAPTAFESRHNVSSSDVGISVGQQNPQTGQFQPLYGAHTQRGYESMRVRMYQFHGSAREPGTITLNFGQYSEEGGVATLPEDATTVDDIYEQHDSVEAAREAAENDPTVFRGGVLGQPSERVEALEHFRLVHAGGPVASSPFDRVLGQQPVNGYDEWVKTFERVDGATVEGTGPANTEVQASVEMEIRSTGQTFIYTQYAETDADGSFEMTLPYSTTGYDEYGPENGHTNVDVRANSSYQFIAPEAPAIGTADVTEAQVVGDDDTPVTVELQTPQIQPSGGNNEGNSTDGDGGSGGDTRSSRTVRTAE